MRIFRYFTKYRPPSPGAVPNVGLHRVYATPERTWYPDANCYAWGYIEYTSPLSDKQIADFELSGPVLIIREQAD